MSDDRVRPIREGVVRSAEKQMVLDYVASEYDNMTDREGEPVALIFAFVGKDGGACAAYFTNKDIQDRNMLFISRGVQAIQTDMAVKWDKIP